MLLVLLASPPLASPPPVMGQQVEDQAADHLAARQQFVDELNAIEGTWTAAVNPRFRRLPLGSAADLCGVKESSLTEFREAVAAGKIALRMQATLGAFAPPKAFDAAERWPQCAKTINDIRDQSNCGCCWAFAAASAASDRMCIASNGSVAVPLSAEDVCFCGSELGCGGGTLFEAWSFIQTTGAVTGAQQTGALANDDPFASGGFCSRFSLPHCHHHGPSGSDPYPAEGSNGCPKVWKEPACPAACDADARSPHASYADDKYTFSGLIMGSNDEASIQHAILTEGPVEAAFTVYTDFENYQSGVYSNKGGDIAGGHAVRIVGWGVDGGTKYWKVANSWNKFWGEDGYFRIKRGVNECGIESQVTAGGGKWSRKAAQIRVEA